jgi:hypothetical protein
MADTPESKSREHLFFPERSFTPRKGRITKDGKFIHERIHSPSTLRKRGYTRFRTVTENKHRIVIAFRGPVSDHDSKVQAKLHPISELHRKHEPVLENVPKRFQ